MNLPAIFGFVVLAAIVVWMVVDVFEIPASWATRRKKRREAMAEAKVAWRAAAGPSWLERRGGGWEELDTVEAEYRARVNSGRGVKLQRVLICLFVVCWVLFGKTTIPPGVPVRQVLLSLAGVWCGLEAWRQWRFLRAHPGLEAPLLAYGRVQVWGLALAAVAVLGLVLVMHCAKGPSPHATRNLKFPSASAHIQYIPIE